MTASRGQPKLAVYAWSQALDLSRSFASLTMTTMSHSIQPGRLRLVVLLSGAGTTLQNLLDRSRGDQKSADAPAKAEPYEVVAVIGSKPDAYGLARAKHAGIPAVCIPRKEYADTDAYSAALWAEIRKYPVDIVVLAGFLHLLRVPEDFRNRIVNIHPALLPSFGGKGMYGIHVHEAVLAAGVKITGCTVHVVDERYDTGPIILQKAVPVLDGDTPEILQARVQAVEREALPEALRLIAGGRVRVEGRRVKVLPVAVIASEQSERSNPLG